MYCIYPNFKSAKLSINMWSKVMCYFWLGPVLRKQTNRRTQKYQNL